MFWGGYNKGMNDMRIRNSPRLIQGFCLMNGEQLRGIIAALGLSFNIYCFLGIQSHYRSRVKRDPYEDELFMLDRIYRNSVKKSNEACPMLESLSTDSEELMTVFGDMIEKFESIGYKTDNPLSFENMLDISGKYLSASLPNFCEPNISIRNTGKENPGLLCLSGGSTFAAEYFASDLRLAVSDAGKEKKIKNGVFIQIARSEKLPLLLWVLKKNGITSFNAGIVEDNIVEYIVSKTESGTVFFSDSLGALSTFGDRDLVICCPNELEGSICRTCTELGLMFRRAGTKADKGKLYFVSPNRTLEIDPLLLRQLSHFENNKIEKVNISKTLISAISDVFFENVTDASLHEDTELLLKEKNHGVISLRSDFGGSPYRSGIEQIICAASALIASGVSREELFCTVDICYPNSIGAEKDKLTALILGIYRAATELCICPVNNHLNISAEVSTPVSRVLALKKAPAEKQGNSSRNWLLFAETDSGELSFENIRKTFSYVSELLSRVPGATARIARKNDSSVPEKVSNAINDVPCAFIINCNAELFAAEGIAVSEIKS